MISRVKALPKLIGPKAKTLNIADDITSAVLKKFKTKLPIASKLNPLASDTVTIGQLPGFSNWNTNITSGFIKEARVPKGLPSIVFKA